MNTRPICILPGNGTLSFTKKEKAPFAPLCMRKKAELYLKFTQKKSFRQEKLPFSCLKIEVSLSSGSYFYNRKLLLQFTIIFDLFFSMLFCIFFIRALTDDIPWSCLCLKIDLSYIFSYDTDT